MEINEIKELVELMEHKNLNILEITKGDEKVRLEKGMFSASYVTSEVQNKEQKQLSTEKNVVKKEENFTEIKSPMVGVFYKAPSPEANPFVSVGSKVKKGDVLCVVEAMKLMNEICAENDGVIKEICANDGQVVEYSQVLFKIV